jgi:phage N-6-adenine-methyltransferase
MGEAIYTKAERERMAPKASNDEMSIHGIANLWPTMAADEWSEFLVDIKTNGLLDPILTWNGKIVDGKHRYRACLETKTQPRFDALPDDWDEWKVAVHCQSKHRRRNLSATQKACVAAEVIEKYGEKANARRSDAVAASNQRRAGKEPITAPGREMDKSTAAAAAARDMGSSERSVERAKFVRDNAPEVYELAKQDKIPIKVAERIAKEPDKDKRAAMIGQLDTGARTDDAGDSWGTPTEWLDLARQTMGGIDLDPATNVEAQQNVKAKHFYTKDDDGLGQEWSGRVWMNPPYSQPLVTQFAEKLVESINAGDVDQACVLVNNATDTRFLQHMLAHCEAALFPRGRIPFLVPGSGEALTGTRQGQVFLYFGKNVDRFVELAQPLGWVGVSP